MRLYRTATKVQLAVLLMVGLALLQPREASSQAPRTISHQGFLTDASGTPVADATRTMRFAIYDAPINGIKKWSETKSVSTFDGLFNTELGSDSTISGFRFDRPLWLGVKVGSDAEIVPRTRLTSVPTAFGLVLPFSAEEDQSVPVIEISNAGTSEAIKASHTAGGSAIAGHSGSGEGVSGTTSTGSGVRGRAFASGGVGGYFWGYESGSTVEPDIKMQGKGLIQSSGTLMLDAISDTVEVDDHLMLGKTTHMADTLYIRTTDLGTDGSELFNEDIQIQASDAFVGLYSDAAGAWGSGLQLGEVNGNVLRDKWSLVRKTYSAGSSLNFTYGTNPNYASNPALVQIDTSGAITAKSVSYLEPRVHFYSINATAFRGSSSLEINTTPGATYVDGGVGLGYLFADVSLPDGARITEFNCIVTDNAALDLRCMLGLRGYHPSPYQSYLSTVETTGTPGYDTLTDPVNWTVDNSDSSLYVEIVPKSGSWYTVGDGLQMNGVIIKYEIDEAP